MPPAAPAPGRLRAVGSGVEDRGGAGEHGLDLRQLAVGEALLGAEDGGGALGAEQRAGDVAGADQGDAVQGGAGRGEVRGGESCEARGAGADLRALRVAQVGAEALQQTGPCIGGGAAAEADDDGAGPGRDRGGDQFAEAAGARRPRGELVPGQGLQTDGLGQLHDRRAVRGQCPAGGAGLPRGAADPGAAQGGARGEGRVHGAVAAVGDGTGCEHGPGGGGGDAAGQRRGHLGRGERALELVRGQQDVRRGGWGHRARASPSTARGIEVPVPRVNHPARGGSVRAVRTTRTEPSGSTSTESSVMPVVREESKG